MLVCDVIEWAEFAVPFVQASIACHAPECLARFAPTYDGLREFMTRKKTPPGAEIFSKYDSLKSVTKSEAELEARLRAELEAKTKAQSEAKLKAEVEVELEAELLRRGGRVNGRVRDRIKGRERLSNQRGLGC